jgi:glutathione S-transferase
VTDSSRIGRYLDERYPEPPLLPKNPTALAYAALLEEWADESLSFIIGAFKWVNPANRRAAVANTVTELTSGLLRPLVGRYLARALRRRYAAWGCGPEALGELHARMREHLAMLSTFVTERDFLLGRTATLADLATFTQLVWMQRYAEGALLAEFPLVTEWQQRVAEIPAVAAALSS